MVTTYYEDFEKWLKGLDTQTVYWVHIYLEEHLGGGLSKEDLREVNEYLSKISKSKLLELVATEFSLRNKLSKERQDQKVQYLASRLDEFTIPKVEELVRLDRLDALDYMDYRGLGYCYRLIEHLSNAKGTLNQLGVIGGLNVEFGLDDTEYPLVYQEFVGRFAHAHKLDVLKDFICKKLEDKFKFDCLHYSQDAHFTGVYETFKLMRVLEAVNPVGLVEFIAGNVDYLEQLDAIGR